MPIDDKEVTISLTSATGWQQWDYQAEEWVTATEPPNTSNLNGAQHKRFRYLAAWDTTTEPNGGNGIHTITISPVSFQVFGGGLWQDPFEDRAEVMDLSDGLTVGDVFARFNDSDLR